MIDINASALSRIMACAGSYALEEPLEEDQSDNAKEGDAGHWCATEVFKNEGELGKPGKKAPNGWATDKDMWDYAGDYVAVVMSEGTKDKTDLEATAHWQATEKIRIRCRVDAFSWSEDGETLRLYDYKYGWRPVEVFENWQLVAGAIGMCRNAVGGPPKRIIMSVYQPRPYHQDGKHRTWEVTLEELAALHDRIIARLTNLDDTLVTGEHCLYCLAAAGHCPAIRTASFNAVDVIMRGQAMELTPEDHAREMELMQRAEALVKQRVSWLEDLAVNRMKQGEILPGWRLAKAFGKTAWNSKKAVTDLAKAAGVKLFERVPVTPAEAIRRGVDEDMVKEHTNRPERGVKLAKGSSAKEAEKVFNK